MADFVIRVGSRSVQGLRANNEDRLLVDLDMRLFLVADGMGGQELGELASGMAAEIIPRVVREGLPRNAGDKLLMDAMQRANEEIIDAGKSQQEGRRMGTTAVCALQHNDTVYVCSIGDSRAYLIRGGQVEQLTVDHSVAQELVNSGALTPEEARFSPYNNVLHKFLGCASMHDRAEVRPYVPQAGDRLLLASDGLTNFVEEDDLRDGPERYPDPQVWVDHLIQSALTRGSRDNITCIVVLFE